MAKDIVLKGLDMPRNKWCWTTHIYFESTIEALHVESKNSTISAI